jgi:hypothetical protein
MRGQKRRNVFYDNQGFPDQSHDFDVLLRNIDGGTILRKRKHPAPALDEIAPEFYAKYDESLHGAKLHKELDLSHLLALVHDKVYSLIQKYRSVFDDKGQFVPVKDYLHHRHRVSEAYRRQEDPLRPPGDTDHATVHR